MARVNKIIEETGGTWGLDQGRQRANETPEKSTSNGGGNMFQTRAPPIGVLGYFVGEDPGVGRQTSTCEQCLKACNLCGWRKNSRVCLLYRKKYIILRSKSPAFDDMRR